MNIFKTQKTLKKHLSLLRDNKQVSIGFVPTMGALHQGHLSLIQQSLEQNDFTICSIFVNPTQFDNAQDLEKYPNTLASDLDLLESVGCDLVYTPTIKDIYKEEVIAEKYNFGGIEKQMEGAHRKGHFDGVATIVNALFEIIQPQKSYFGEKDFQQLQIIRKLVEINKMPIQVIGMPIFREKNGLAMSSRNERLTPEMKQEAPEIYRILELVKAKRKELSLFELQKIAEQAFAKTKLELEYFIIAEEKSLETAQQFEDHKTYRAFVAAFAGEIRLIDNLDLK